VKILYIDTTRDMLTVALVTKTLFTVRTNNEQRRHSESINQIAKEFLTPDLDAFAVVCGSGSWTGSRVGVVAVKSWALVFNKPIIALTQDDNIDTAREKFLSKDFTSINDLAPIYDSEFKITLTSI